MGKALQIRLQAVTRQDAAQQRWPGLVRCLAADEPLRGQDMARRLPQVLRLSLTEAGPLLRALFCLEEHLGAWQTVAAQAAARELEHCLDQREALLHNPEERQTSETARPPVLLLETVAVFWNLDLLPRLWPALFGPAAGNDTPQPVQPDDLLQVAEAAARRSGATEHSRTADLLAALRATLADLRQSCADNLPAAANACSDRLEEQLSRLDAVLPGGHASRRRWLPFFGNRNR